jgi:hypothetical protein
MNASDLLRVRGTGCVKELIPGPQGVMGAMGNTGSTGSTGPIGIPGAGGALGYYVSYYSSVSQTIPASSTQPTQLTLNGLFYQNGFPLNTTGVIVFQYPGTYLVSTTVQLSTNGGCFELWYVQNGTMIPNSTNEYRLVAGASQTVAMNQIMVRANALDTLSVWGLAQGNDMTLRALPADPIDRYPATCSVVITISQVAYNGNTGPTGTLPPLYSSNSNLSVVNTPVSTILTAHLSTFTNDVDASQFSLVGLNQLIASTITLSSIYGNPFCNLNNGQMRLQSNNIQIVYASNGQAITLDSGCGVLSSISGGQAIAQISSNSLLSQWTASSLQFGDASGNYAGYSRNMVNLRSNQTSAIRLDAGGGILNTTAIQLTNGISLTTLYSNQMIMNTNGAATNGITVTNGDSGPYATQILPSSINAYYGDLVLRADGPAGGSNIKFVLNPSNQYIILSSIPTRNPGIPGALWNNGGALYIS